MHCISIFSDLYADESNRDENDSCASDNDFKYTDKVKCEKNVKLSADDMENNEHKLDEINDFDEDNDLLLNGNLGNEETQVNHFGNYQHEN